MEKIKYFDNYEVKYRNISRATSLIAKDRYKKLLIIRVSQEESIKNV